MSFFAYIALVDSGPGDAEALATILDRHGLAFRPVRLALEFGASCLYGRNLAPDRLREFELGEGTQGEAPQDIERLLLEPEFEDGRWRHYHECARGMGRTVRDFHDDEEVDQRYIQTPLPLRVTALIRDLGDAVRARPIILNLDPEFEMKNSGGDEICGLSTITRRVWELVAFRDLEKPIRLVLEP